MNTRGVVLEKRGSHYIVSIENPADKCKDCALAALCKAQRSNVVVATSDFDLKVGQTVELKYSEASLIAIYATVFLVPVAVMILLLAVFNSALIAAIGTALAFVALKLSDKWLAGHLAKPIAVPA